MFQDLQLFVIVVFGVHAVHSTAWWSRSEGLWTGPEYPFQQSDKSPKITDQHTTAN